MLQPNAGRRIHIIPGVQKTPALSPKLKDPHCSNGISLMQGRGDHLLAEANALARRFPNLPLSFIGAHLEGMSEGLSWVLT